MVHMQHMLVAAMGPCTGRPAVPVHNLAVSNLCYGTEFRRGHPLDWSSLLMLVDGLLSAFVGCAPMDRFHAIVPYYLAAN